MVHIYVAFTHEKMLAYVLTLVLISAAASVSSASTSTTTTTPDTSAVLAQDELYVLASALVLAGSITACAVCILACWKGQPPNQGGQQSEKSDL